MTRLRVVIAAVGLCLSTVVHLSAADLSAEDGRRLQQAQDAVNSGRHADAVPVLLALQKKYPDNGDVPRLLTHAHFGLQQWDKARATALDALSAGRLTSDVLIRLAQIDEELDDRLALTNTVRLLTVLDANNRQWRLILGDLLVDAGSLSEAAAILSALVKLEPDSASLHARLGNIMLRQERLADAAETLETAWYLGERDPRLALNIAAVWQQLDDGRLALEWTQRAFVASRTPDQPLQLRLSHLLFSLKEDERSWQRAEPLTRSTDEQVRSEAHVLLGRIATRRDQPMLAIEHWRKAVESGVDSPQLLATVGAHFFNAGDFQRAAVLLKRVVAAEDGENEKHLRFLAVSLIRAGDPTARDVVRQYIERFGLTDEAKNLIRLMSRA